MCSRLYEENTPSNSLSWPPGGDSSGCIEVYALGRGYKVIDRSPFSTSFVTFNPFRRLAGVERKNEAVGKVCVCVC